MEKLFLKIHNVKEEKLEIIFRGVNIEEFNINQTKEQLREKLNISLEKFVILTVSRIHPRKGIETVINALNSIIENDPKFPIKYFIIGEGKETEKLKNLVLNLKLESHVKFLGVLNDNLRNKYYKLSDLFILVPQIMKNSIEGFGIVYIEASYFRLPVIGSCSGGIKVAIVDGKTGFVIEPNNVLSLREKILLLYANKKLRSDMGKFGHNRVVKDFNWNNNALIYKNLLKNTIKEYLSK